jgi:hypothetical protein
MYVRVGEPKRSVSVPLVVLPWTPTASKAGVFLSSAWVATKARYFAMSRERTVSVAGSTPIQSLTYDLVMGVVPGAPEVISTGRVPASGGRQAPRDRTGGDAALPRLAVS